MDKTKTIAWLAIGTIVLVVASFILLNVKLNKLVPQTKELQEENPKEE